jgi:peptidoglycan/LPS O-acetylase OafA/YrhL
MVNEIKFINLFRALAAFWVLTAHCMIWGGWHGLPLPSPKIAVDLFMIISGYLMTANAVEREKKESLTKLRNQIRFWLRRFFRIAPAYYLSLFVAVVTKSYFLSGYQKLQNLNPEKWSANFIYDPKRIEYTFKNIFIHVSFLFGVHPTWSFSTFLPDWSLSLEMQFYVVFPALILFFTSNDLMLFSTVIGLSAFAFGVFINNFAGYYEPSLLLFKLNYFITGILAFHILNSISEMKKSIGLILTAYILVSLDVRYKWQWPVLPLLLSIFLYIGWLEKVARAPRWLRILLNNKLVQFASNASYGVYLFHGFFISAFGLILYNFSNLLSLSPTWRVLLMLIFVTSGAYVTAYIVFRWIESPGIAFGKLVIRRFVSLKSQNS